MSLPPTLETSLTPQELTFITEEQEIEIVPAFSMSKIRLVSVRPLLPRRPMQVLTFSIWV